MYSQITFPTPAIAVLTITDAGALNVLGTPVIQGLIQALGELAENQELHCLVLRGSGSRAFVAGADIKELSQLNASTGRAFIGGLRDLCNAVRHFPVPVIVRLEGHTLGGGLELAMAGDLRIAADNAVVGMPEVKVGIPSVIHAAMMPAQIGTTRAAWLLLTGENIPATQARDWGLINECVPQDQLDERIMQVAVGLAQIGPVVLRQQKRLLRRWERMTLDAAVDDSIAEFGEAFKTGEPQHHMNAFLERKKAASKPD
ncbi:enoyl-CoA hydratase [Diaphorobacter aerolatus]|uniref:Enoyl-CoA hydratase/isomerase family protein n=1 Tax=Diaphorobacter aerolatus TaxID=1288495 RepID=A0A7H0GI24_9BURK|nr:enoyl-CoA hydratase [Diaphorobacter aerolatus]QNP47940.1 enoyl-CoA hydratase/isomerase family protein [Diaphorobacter aerolatus]